MDLAIRAKGKRNFFKVQNLAGHNGLRSVDLRYTPLHREVIEQLDRIKNYVHQNDFGDVLERQRVLNQLHPLLDHTNLTFDEGLVFVCAC
jgi:hypothetical protein